MDVTVKRPKAIPQPTTLAHHLKNRRIELGLLQKDVAQIMDVCEDTITYWKRGRAMPQITHYPKIIAFLGFNPFVTETDTLGGKIRKYRIEKGPNQEELAKVLEVDESTIFHWENNGHSPLPSKMRILEKLINQRDF